MTNGLALWLQGTQAIAAVATTISVMIALYVALIREPRKAAEERRRHQAQVDALRRAARKRVAAQARKVVPSWVRAPMFGDMWWTVRIDNTSNAVTTILAIDVAAIDADGIRVPDGCRQARNTMPVDQALDRSIRAALSGGGSEGSQHGTRLSPALKHAVQNALVGHLAHRVGAHPAPEPPHRDGVHNHEA